MWPMWSFSCLNLAHMGLHKIRGAPRIAQEGVSIVVSFRVQCRKAQNFAKLILEEASENQLLLHKLVISSLPLSLPLLSWLSLAWKVVAGSAADHAAGIVSRTSLAVVVVGALTKALLVDTL